MTFTPTYLGRRDRNLWRVSLLPVVYPALLASSSNLVMKPLTLLPCILSFSRESRALAVACVSRKRALNWARN